MGSSNGRSESPNAGGAQGDACAAEAKAALLEAQRLVEGSNLVVEAEALLAELLERLEAPGASEQAAAAAREVRDAPIFDTIIERAQQYERIAAILDPSNFRQMWAKDGAALWINAPAGAHYFEYRMVATLDATLSEFVAVAAELDLVPRYNPFLIGAPSVLGGSGWTRLIVRSLIGFLMMRVEAIVEVVRFVDTKVGFLAEHISHDFPTEGVPIPPKVWSTRRVQPFTLNIALPCGGGQKGLIFVSKMRVDVGIPIPTFITNFFCNVVAADSLNNLRKSLKLAQDPQSPWFERLAQDKDGFYAKLNQAEAAASKREAFSMEGIPGQEIFQKPKRLTKTRPDASLPDLKANTEGMSPSTAPSGPEESCHSEELCVEL